MDIPGMVTHWTEAISCAGINPCSPEGELSVTEQITVFCLLSRLDRPMLTAEAAILPATVEKGMMVHQPAPRICELHQ